MNNGRKCYIFKVKTSLKCFKQQSAEVKNVKMTALILIQSFIKFQIMNPEVLRKRPKRYWLAYILTTGSRKKVPFLLTVPLGGGGAGG